MLKPLSNILKLYRTQHKNYFPDWNLVVGHDGTGLFCHRGDTKRNRLHLFNNFVFQQHFA